MNIMYALGYLIGTVFGIGWIVISIIAIVAMIDGFFGR